jgi:CRP/FNR family transcriptional regulator
MFSKDETVKWIESNFPELNDSKLLSEISKVGLIRNFKESSIIIDYGEAIDYIPLVINGSVKISREGEDGREIFLYYLTNGDTCAASFSCCMVKKRSEILAVAEEDSTILMIPMNEANSWLKEYDSWRNFIFNMYDQRMFSMIDMIDRLAFTNLDDQLMDYLERKSETLRTNVIESTHQQIAQDLNVSREAVSRLLKKLEHNGKVKLGRNKVILNE